MIKTGKKISVTKGTQGYEVRAYTSLKDSRNSVATRTQVTASGTHTMVSAAGASGTNAQEGYLTGIINTDNKTRLENFRDMYAFDSIAGCAVDLMSELPFSDITLHGCSGDSVVLNKYKDAIANINIRASAAAMTRQYLVEGSSTSTLVIDPKSKVIIDQLSYKNESLTFKHVPLLGRDPVITARVGADFNDFLNDDSDPMIKLREKMPKPLMDSLQSGEYVLDPYSTLHLSRTLVPNGEPVSYLNRILPVYLMEKTLYRGTLFELGRRQRANLHIQAGNDMWEPTPEELATVASVFQQTDLDPMGAIVVTRDAVNVSEFRAGGDFYKWTDAYDQHTAIKLKALGISDAFLSSESTYSNAEQAVVVFMDTLAAYRQYFTHKVFTSTLFPLVAMTQGLYKDGNSKEFSNLNIPEVRWSKQLTAQSSDSMFELLEKLSEHGVPMPIRLWLAASGISAEDLLSDLAEDGDLLERLNSFGTGSNNGEEDDLDMASFSGTLALPHGQGVRRIVEEGRFSDVFSDRGGRFHLVANQTQGHRKVNETIVQAVSNLKDPNAVAKARAAVRKRKGRR